MGVILGPLLMIVGIVLGLLKWAVILNVILSWLLAFGIVNVHNQFVNMVGDMLFRITEPFLSRIRRFLPSMGAFDLSPLVFILILLFIEMVVGQLALRASLL
ncbi:MAG: YggT family protein [Alphaproteobacteria bacterium]|jgi:YggT family protein|nr:YggT family protein [Alphaproteobacteria bacterium]